MRTRTLIVAAGMLFGCAACGFKGPLYLPRHTGVVVTHPADSTPAPAPAPAQRKTSRNQGTGSGAPPP
jgi:predicted small lipoprotein YifL